MARNVSRSAADRRRGKWRQQDKRALQYERMGLYVTDGSAALAVDRSGYTPKQVALIPSLCDGLISVIRRMWRFGWWYVVRVGNDIREVSEETLKRLWAMFYAQFESVAGVNATKQPTPTTTALLPAPQQPFALLPSGVTQSARG